MDELDGDGPEGKCKKMVGERPKITCPKLIIETLSYEGRSGDTRTHDRRRK